MGWGLAVSDGVVLPAGSQWFLQRPPGGGKVLLALPVEAGWVVAGRGSCWLLTPAGWRECGSGDQFTSGAALRGEALLAGRQGIYLVNRQGMFARVWTGALGSGVKVAEVGGELMVFGGPGGVWRWTKGALVPAGPEFSWARECAVVDVSETGEGRTFATDHGVFALTREARVPLLPSRWNDWFHEGLVAAVQLDGQLVVATFFGGVAGYSPETGTELWRIRTDAFRGEVYCLRSFSGGLLVGSASGLYVIPNPARLAYAPLPPGDVYFAEGASDGLLVGLPSGVYAPSGTVPPAITGRVFSLVERAPGHYLAGRFGDVVDDGVRQALPAREVSAVAVSGPVIGLIDPEGVSLLVSGRVQRVSLPGAANSLAAVNAGFLVGTAAGAWTVAADGGIQAAFGSGLTKVHPFHGQAIGLDATGTLFDAGGRKLARLPFADLIDAVPWEGGVCLLARFASGKFWVGSVDLASGSWTPFDLPLPRSPAALRADASGLYVVAPGEVLWARDPPTLPAPALDLGNLLPGGLASLRLPSSRSEVDLLLPSPRLAPWPSPVYSARVAEGPWTEYEPGLPMRFERLPWGRSMISVRAAWAGRERIIDVAIERARPWWARWPAAAAYALSLLLLVWLAVRWRTAHLHRRAKQLQGEVDERTAELRHAQQAREEFFSTLSHEIRNPLNGVVGLCEMIEQAPSTALAPRERMLMTTLRGCSDQLRSLLDDVLDFSRIDRGEIQLNSEIFCVQTAVEGVAGALDPSFEKCHLDVPEREVWLTGDVGKLRQVLTNLVGNAFKYGVPPECHVLVSVSPEAGDRAKVSVGVRNTGPTIPPDELAQIFEPFARGSEAIRRRIPGSGIGLAVSRRMVEAMGGELTARSTDGLTEFRLELVLPLAEPPPSAPPALAVPGGFRVLAVEDETYNRFVLGHLLGRLGYEVDWAVDGASALERITTGAYDLILTDYLLPDITGAELARRILEIVPEPKPPIIAVTAYSTVEKMAEARAAGIRGFVTKPISEKKLAAAILRLGTRISLHRPQDPPASSADFTALLRLEHGRQVLLEYSRDLAATWEGVTRAMTAGETEAAAKAVHAFRSSVLAVRAQEPAEQLALLEDCVREGRWTDAQRIAAVVGPMIADLAGLARQRAFQEGAER